MTNTVPLPADERFDLGSDDFMMAFAVENTQLEPKNDKRYIRWQANVI